MTAVLSPIGKPIGNVFHDTTEAETAASVTPADPTTPDIELERYGATRAIATTPSAYSDDALNDAADVSENDSNRPVKARGGNYLFNTNIVFHQGTKFLGEGSQGAGNDNRLIHEGTGDFLTWDGNGDNVAGTGCGISHFQVVKASGASGGTALTFIATDDNHRPGELQIDDILITGDGVENWAVGLKVDGTAADTAGTKGVRSGNVNKLRVADCSEDYKSVWLNQAVHWSFNHLQTDQGTGGAPGVTIEGDSDNIGMVNSIINGTVKVEGSHAINLNIHGRFSGYDNNNASVEGTVVGSCADLTNASKSVRIVSSRADAFAAYLSASTTSDKTGDGTDYDVICDTELFDRNDSFDNTNGTHTVKCAGPYQYTMIWTYTNLGAGHTTSTSGFVHRDSSGVTIRSYKAGGVNPYAMAAGGAGGECTRTMSIFVEMAEGEKMAFVADVNGAGGKVVGIKGGNLGTMHTWISGKLLA